jgi:hypothetical protein
MARGVGASTCGCGCVRCRSSGVERTVVCREEDADELLFYSWC